MVNPGHECTLLHASSCQYFFYVFNFNSVMLGRKVVFRKNITAQWECLLNPFHHMLYEIGKTTLQNSDFIQIWNVIQIWISFQNESVRLESDLKNSIMALPYLSISSSICVEMLKFGTFCHFQKAHRAPDWFVSLSNLPKIKDLGALCKVSLCTQNVRKW